MTEKRQALIDFLTQGVEDTKEGKVTNLPYRLAGLKIFLEILEGTKFSTDDKGLMDAVHNYARRYGCESLFGIEETKEKNPWQLELESDSDAGEDESMSGMVDSPYLSTHLESSYFKDEKREEEEDNRDQHIQFYLGDRRFPVAVFPNYRVNLTRVVTRLALKEPSSAQIILSQTKDEITKTWSSGIPCIIWLNGVRLSFKQLKYGIRGVVDWSKLEWPLYQ